MANWNGSVSRIVHSLTRPRGCGGSQSISQSLFRKSISVPLLLHEMSSFMVVELEIAGESLTTDGTQVERNASVSITVIAESIKPAERFVAFGAFIWLLTSMHTLMPF